MSQSLSIKLSPTRIWFGLLIIYIVSGYLAQDVLLPSLVNQVCMYIFLACSVLFIILSGKQHLTGIVVWQVVFMILSLIAMTYSPKFSLFDGTYYALIVNFALVYILAQMPWTEKRFDIILKTYVFSAAGLIIALALTGNLEDETGRLGEELFGNANTLATMLMMSAVCCVWLVVTQRQTKRKVLYIIMLIAIYIGLFLSGGRKYIVVPVVFLYFLLLKRTDKKGRHFIIRNTIIVAVIFVILYKLIMEVPEIYERIGYRFEGFFGLFNDEYEVDSSTGKRVEMIQAAWKQWKSKPLFGYGFDSFKYYNAREVTGHFYYSHNNYVELLYNQGLVGLVGYYSFYAALFVKAMKEKRNTLVAGFAIATVISLLFFDYWGIAYSVTPIQIMLFLAYKKLQLSKAETANTDQKTEPYQVLKQQ